MLKTSEVAMMCNVIDGNGLDIDRVSFTFTTNTNPTRVKGSVAYVSILSYRTVTHRQSM